MTRPHKNRLEWSVFAVSAIVVVAVLAYLGWCAIHDQQTPPDLRIFTGAAVAAADTYRVPIVVRNDGESTAESVRIEVLLMRANEEIERADLELPFVPRQSEREAWVTFRHDPRCCTLQSRAVGYETP
ncbi:MAG TPA: hypothetical protein VF883_07570 [Thermoanaerobaculia bacterium]|jgi:uncharacterized protein (TIGR02588 family)